MTFLRSRIKAVAATTAVLLSAAFTAFADVPPAVDRVPTDALVVASIRNLTKFQSTIEMIGNTLNVPDRQEAFKTIDGLLKTPGLNPEGSVALVLMDGDMDGPQGPVVAVIPVKDYKAFATGLGGAGTGSIEQITFQDEPVFVKDLGGGYAAMGPVKEIVTAFDGKPGRAKDHEKFIGATGGAVASANDTLMIANLPALAPRMKKGYESFRQQMTAMAQMAGGNAGNTAVMDALAEGFMRDGQAGVVGLKGAEQGVTLDMACQFKEGSEFAGYFSTKGKSGSLLANVPANPYLFAVSMDTSSAGIKKFFSMVVDASKKAAPAGGDAMKGLYGGWMDNVAKMDGMALVMGTSPALLGGGLFVNTVAYTKTSDPAGYIKSLKDSFEAMSKSAPVNGITFEGTYEPGASKIGDTPVDAWSMKMSGEGEAAQQLQMMQGWLFGPTGFAGFVAPASGGVVVTYSKNTPLMEQSLNVAKAGNGLGADAGVTKVAGSLPSDRSFESYIGIKSILETAMGFMAMAGGGQPDVKIPQDLPPIGIGGTTHTGGVRTTIHCPMAVLDTFKKLGDSMGGGGHGGDMEDAPADDKGGGQPRF